MSKPSGGNQLCNLMLVQILCTVYVTGTTYLFKVRDSKLIKLILNFNFPQINNIEKLLYAIMERKDSSRLLEICRFMSKKWFLENLFANTSIDETVKSLLVLYV